MEMMVYVFSSTLLQVQIPSTYWIFRPESGDSGSQSRALECKNCRGTTRLYKHFCDLRPVAGTTRIVQIVGNIMFHKPFLQFPGRPLEHFTGCLRTRGTRQSGSPSQESILGRGAILYLLKQKCFSYPISSFQLSKDLSDNVAKH